MPFKIIQTIEGNKKKLFTVPSGWEIDNILRYPNKAPSKYIKDENSKPSPDWEIMKCTVKRMNISSYEAGDKQISEMMKYSDTDETDDDNRLQPRRPKTNLKTLNLNSMAEKLVANNISTNNQYTPAVPSSSADLTNEFTYEIAYLDESQANSSMPSQILSNNVYQATGEDIINTTVPQQDSVSVDVDKIFEHQKMILENQMTIMSEIIISRQQQQDSHTEIIGQIQNLMKVQNSLTQKVSSLSVQLENAVSQITSVPGSEDVTSLHTAKGLIENIPLNIKPINSVQDLEELEKQLSDKNNRYRLQNSYSILCSGGKGLDCAYMLIDVLFTRTFICQCSWSGGSRGEELKVPLKGYKHVLSFFWQMINFWDKKYTLKDNELFFKTILKNAQKRKLAKHERASTSRQRSKRVKSCLEEESKTTSRDKVNIESENKENECESRIESQQKHTLNVIDEESKTIDSIENTNLKNSEKDTSSKDTAEYQSEEEESLC